MDFLSGIPSLLVIGILAFACLISFAMGLICIRAAQHLAVVVIALILWAAAIVVALMFYIQAIQIFGANIFLIVGGVVTLCINGALASDVYDELS